MGLDLGDCWLPHYLTAPFPNCFAALRVGFPALGPPVRYPEMTDECGRGSPEVQLPQRRLCVDAVQVLAQG
jgi:hypothetical protein